MYEIYLTETTEDSAHPHLVANIYVIEDQREAFDICTALQPYLRDGVEAHFASEDAEPQHFASGDTGHTAAELAYGQG